MPFCTEIGLGLRDIVYGDLAPPPLKGHSPQFSANVRCSQTAGWSKMPFGMDVGFGPGDFVFDGDPAAPRKKGYTHPTHVCCGRTAEWIKMPLGTEVNVGSGDVVLDGGRCSLKRGTSPQFVVCLLWPNGFIDEGATC